jgi:hypothetical protein
MLLLALLQGPPSQAPARPWALTLDAVGPISVPGRVRAELLAELE